MKLALLGSLALTAAAGVSAQNMDDENNVPIGNEDPFSSRSLAASPVPVHVVAMLSLLNFFNALQESWSDQELGREMGDQEAEGEGGRLSGMWRAIKRVPGVFYETGSMVAPLTLRYFLADESEHPHCQQVMLCEMNVRVKERFGKPGEIAMQLASSMAGYAIGGNDPQRYDSLVDAARNGRRGKECTELYPKCVARSDGGQLPAMLRLASRLINKKPQ